MNTSSPGKRCLTFERLEQRTVLASPFGTPELLEVTDHAVERPWQYDLKPNAFVEVAENGESVIRNYFFGTPPQAIFGVYRDGQFDLDTHARGQEDGEQLRQMPADNVPDKVRRGGIPVVGDWDGQDGVEEVGLFFEGDWYLYPNGLPDPIYVQFGLPGDQPVVGDWNGDGKDDLGVYRTGGGFGSFLLDDSCRGWDGLGREVVVGFGLDSARPLAGDWDADGVDEVGVFQLGQFYLTFEDPGPEKNGSAVQPVPSLPFYEIDQTIPLPDARPDDVPLAYDHDNDGVTEVGVFRNESGAGYFYFDTRAAGFSDDPLQVDKLPQFGRAGDRPIVGDWYDPAPRRHIPGDRILLSESFDNGRTWTEPQVVYVGDWTDDTISGADHLLGSPSVVKHDDVYYMFVEGIGTEVFVVNRYLNNADILVADSFTTNAASLQNTWDGKTSDLVGYTDPGNFINYGLGYATPYAKKGTHPVFAAEVTYPNGRVNRYLSLEPIDPGTDQYGHVRRQLNLGGPVFFLFDRQFEGDGRDDRRSRIPVWQYFDLTISDTFVVHGEDDVLLQARRAAGHQIFPVPELLGYMGESIASDDADFGRAPMNHVTMLTSHDGIHWQEFAGPVEGSSQGAVIGPLNIPEEIGVPRYDLEAARRGWTGPQHGDPGSPWGLARAKGIPGNVYGAGYPSALIRDGYLELYFTDYSDRPAPGGYPRRGAEASRVVIALEDLEDPAAWAEAAANRTLFSQEANGQWPDIQDIRWVPELKRYVTLDGNFGADGPGLFWSEISHQISLGQDAQPDFRSSLGQGIAPLFRAPEGRRYDFGTLVADEKGQLHVHDGRLVSAPGADSLIGVFEAYDVGDTSVFQADLDVAGIRLPVLPQNTKIEVNGGVAWVTGTYLNDTIRIRESDGGQIRLLARNDFATQSATFPASQVWVVVADGREGNDLITNTTAVSSWLLGGAGDDRLAGGRSADWLDGGTGNDHLSGYAGNDQIVGGSGDDLLYGNDGDDRLFGGDGNDKLSGHAGDDRLDGGGGNDRLYAHEGRDVLHGNDGDDRLDGGAGDDQLYGDRGRDVVFGQLGDDYIDGGEGDDLLYGEDGNDLILGQGGNDSIRGGRGNDRLFGLAGHDRLYGEDGNDEIDGGDGHDILDGGTGANSLRGGAGTDHFRVLYRFWQDNEILDLEHHLLEWIDWL